MQPAFSLPRQYNLKTRKTFSDSSFLPMQNYNKAIARISLKSMSFTSTECRYQRFLDTHRILKACIHETKNICVDLNVRKMSHKQMNTLPNLKSCNTGGIYCCYTTDSVAHISTDIIGLLSHCLATTPTGTCLR